MAQYVLDLTKPHRQSMIELVNNDNVATIGTDLTLTNTNLINPRAVAVEEGVPRSHAVTLQNAAYAADTVEVFYNKIALTDCMTMPASYFDGWYDPDTWDEGTSPAAALAALTQAATDAGVTLANVLESLVITRVHNAQENRYYLHLEFDSFVFNTGAEFIMPKHFSETVTVTNLGGFIYDPIAPESVTE